MIRRLLAVLALAALLSGCGYTLVENPDVERIGAGDFSVQYTLPPVGDE